MLTEILQPQSIIFSQEMNFIPSIIRIQSAGLIRHYFIDIQVEDVFSISQLRDAVITGLNIRIVENRVGFRSVLFDIHDTADINNSIRLQRSRMPP